MHYTFYFICTWVQYNSTLCLIGKSRSQAICSSILDPMSNLQTWLNWYHNYITCMMLNFTFKGNITSQLQSRSNKAEQQFRIKDMKIWKKKKMKCIITKDILESIDNSPRYCNFIGKRNSTLQIRYWWNMILFLIDEFNYLKQNIT